MVPTIKRKNHHGVNNGAAVSLSPSPSNMRGYIFSKKTGMIILFIAPAFIIYSVFMAFPLIMSIKLSFYSTIGAGISDFVGLQNFQTLFLNETVSKRFFNALINNGELFVITMLLQNVLGLFIATILHKGLRFFGLIRTVLFLPVTISIVLVGFIWTLILNPNWGIINKSLTAIGLDSWALPWLGNEHTALIAIAVVNAWQYIGLAIMFFVAGLQNIPHDLYEAASIDGANAWNKFIHVTLPQLNPVIGIVTILTIVGDFNQFELTYAMEGTAAGPNYATDVLGTLFYRTAFSSYGGSQLNLGLGAAISSVSFFVIFVLVLIWLYFTQWKKSR